MPSRLLDTLDNWANGILTSVQADAKVPAFSPRGKNTTLVDIGVDTARIAKRKGLTLFNSIPVTGSPQILGGFNYKKKSGTKYNLLIGSNGRLDSVDASGTLSTINATAFTSGASHVPNFAVANDLCFIFNDVEAKKFDGTNVQGVGITRPAAPTAAAAAGGAMATGIWDVSLSYYNSATGNLSSSGDITSVTLTAGNQKINVSWLAPADTQVTHVMVQVRQQSAGANIYRVTAGATPAPDVTTGGFPVATLSTVLDISASQYAAFITIAPSINENNPPPAGLQYPTWHHQRMFLADSGTLYYSNFKNGTPFPEAFNPLNLQPVNPNDGDSIVGLYSTHGKLYIFKKLSIWQLEGTDPASWTVSLVSHDFGSSSHRSAIDIEGTLFWYAGTNGPVSKSLNGPITPLGKQLLATTISATVLNQTALATVVVGQLERTQEVVWAVPELGNTRNTLMLPLNYRLSKFSSDGWTVMDVSALWTVETTDQLKALFMGGYSGQVFQFSTAGNDGVPSGTTSGTVSSATASTLTDTTATFLTSGGKLIERYVYAISTDGQTIQRRRITGNTGTVLTVTPNWTTTPNNVYTYVVGGIDFQLDTPWVSTASGFLKKKNEFFFIEATSSDSGTTLSVDFFKDMDEIPKKTKTMSLSSTGGIYDTSLFDSAARYGSATGTASYDSLRVAMTSKTWKARLRNIQVDHDLSIYRVAMRSVPLGMHV